MGVLDVAQPLMEGLTTSHLDRARQAMTLAVLLWNASIQDAQRPDAREVARARGKLIREGVPKAVLDKRNSELDFWVRLSGWVMRHARAVAAATVAFLVLLAVPVLWLEVGPGSNKGIPQNLEGVKGLNVISDAVGEGALAPTAIVGDTGRAGGVDSTAVRAAIGDLEQGLRADREVAAVQFGDGPQYIDPTSRYFHLEVIGKSEYGSPPALHFVDRLRDEQRFDEAQTRGEAALELLQVNQQRAPLYWFALWPLIGAAAARGRWEETIAPMRGLLEPTQQPQPATLANCLEAALQAWDAGQPDVTRARLEEAIPLANELGYL